MTFFDTGRTNTAARRRFDPAAHYAAENAGAGVLSNSGPVFKKR